MKDLGILTSTLFSFVRASLGKARQGVSSSVSFTLSVIDSEMLPKEFLSPSDLTRAQALRVHKPTEVVVLGEHEDFVLTTFQVELPGFGSFKNG